MKKKNLLVGLLSMAFVVTSAFAFGSCNREEPEGGGDNSAEVAQYLKYTLNEDGQSYSVGFWSGIEEVQEIIDNENIENEEDLIKYISDNYPQTNVKGVLTISAEYNGLPITVIRDGGFLCSSFDSVIIPNSITTIGEGAFIYCSSLTNIEVSEGNSEYKDIDGNLYSKDGSTLIQYAIGKTATEFIIPDSVITIGHFAFELCSSLTSVVIGDSVTTIEDSAFYKCESLTNVIIPDSVTTIGYSTFSDCTSLTSVVIPGSVTTIGNFAFDNCDSLTSVYYKGTAEEWAEISVGEYNGNLINATIYYFSENAPTSEGNYWHYDTDGVTILVWGKEE